MTLAEFQPHVEKAVAAMEWNTARSRRLRSLAAEQDALWKALENAGQYGVEEAPLKARLDQIPFEMARDIDAGEVPVSPLRSVPMDMIAEAAVRRLLNLPSAFPILSIKVLPSPEMIEEAVTAIASRWKTPNGQIPVEA
jgi:hypothetical protein